MSQGSAVLGKLFIGVLAYIYPVLTEARLILCDFCRSLQVLHLQSGMNAHYGDPAASRKVLRSLRRSAPLRVLSLIRSMQVRRVTMGDSNPFGYGRDLAGLQPSSCILRRASMPILRCQTRHEVAFGHALWQHSHALY